MSNTITKLKHHTTIRVSNVADIRPNPFRDMKQYPLQRKKIEALRESRRCGRVQRPLGFAGAGDRTGLAYGRTMSLVDRKDRSFKSIRPEDLQRLAEIARTDRTAFFKAYPDWARHYADRFLCSALCQGAALHHLYGEVGINDFDVYNFFATNAKRRWYAKRLKSYDFGDGRFGQSSDRQEFIGRRVDLMGRALTVRNGANPVEVLRSYLQAGKTDTSRRLAEKAVVLLEPEQLLGRVVWPIQ